MKTTTKNYWGVPSLLLLILASPALWAGDGDWQWDGDGVPLGDMLGDDFDVTSDGAGGVIVVSAWDYNPDLDRFGRIVVQRLNGQGAPLWSPADGLVISSTGGHASVSGDGQGGAVFGWEDTDGIYVQRVDPNGVPLWTAGGAKVASTGWSPEIVADPYGGALVGFVGSGNAAWVVHVHNSGSPMGGSALGGQVNFPFHLQMVSDGGGGAIVAYIDPARRVFAQRYYFGQLPWGPFGLMLGNYDVAYSLRAFSDGAGGALLSWATAYTLPSRSEVRVQRIDGSGNQLWTPFGVVVVDSDDVGGVSDNVKTDITSDGSGGAIVTWTDYRHPWADDDIYAQRIDAAGSVVWTPQGVLVPGLPFDPSQPTPGTQTDPRIASDGQGGAVITFTDYGSYGPEPDISAARLDQYGHTHWYQCVVLDSHSPQDPGVRQSWPQIVSDGSGLQPPGAVVVWDDEDSDGPLIAQKLELSAPGNDDCADAKIISGNTLYGSLIGATVDGSASCAYPTQPDVWYRYTPQTGGTLTVTTCGTNDLFGTDLGVDTIVSVHSGCPGTQANQLAGGCNDDWDFGDPPTMCQGDDAGESLDSAMRVGVAPDQPVYIRVSRYIGSHADRFVVSLDLHCAPSREVCDGLDNDCDGLVDEGFDSDGDGVTTCGGDCDDGNPHNYPGNTELCDRRDNDCDGQVDEGFDVDGDGTSTCGGDCDDHDPLNFPFNPEVCDEQDNDCDGQIDEGLSMDNDGDGHTQLGACSGTADDCDDGDPLNFPGNAEVCDGQDNDCDAQVDEGHDADGDGHTTCGGDCNDANPSQYPGRPELCDGLDNDCDGGVDENFDADGDGHTTCGGDCNDTSPSQFPGNPELCDGLDNDCDGAVDEDFDADGDGITTCAGDCDDGDPSIPACNTFPGTSVTDPTGQVSVTFGDGTSPGYTSVVVGPCGSSGTADIVLTTPDGVCVAVETTAAFDEATICVNYDEPPPYVNEEDLRLVHVSGSKEVLPLWPGMDPNPDTVANLICAVTTHFSVFALGRPSAGRVPAGTFRVGKRSPLELELVWDESCSPMDTDYVVYEGMLGDFTSHSPVLGQCTTGGAITTVLDMAQGDRYYLVVPTNGAMEGSHGLSSEGERPRGNASCYGQAIVEECP